MKYRNFFYPFKFSTDLAILTLSFLLSSFLAKRRIFLTQGFFSLERREWFLLVLLVIIWYFSSRATHLYDEFRTNTIHAELICVSKNVGIQLAAAMILLFLFQIPLLSRFFILLDLLFLLVLLGHAKIIFRIILRKLQNMGRNIHSILIIGAGKVGQDFFQAIKSFPHLGYRVVGFLDGHPQPSLGTLYLGKLEDLLPILEQKNVDEVVIALPGDASEDIDQIISICEGQTVPVRMIPDILGYLRSRLSVSLFGNFPVFSVRSNPLEETEWRLLKRLFDMLIAVVLFLGVFSWLWPLIAIAVKLDSRGPVFFKQERWGRKNKKIVCYKFRTMFSWSREVDSNGRYQPTGKNDPRVTRVGRLLRRTSLDELPQFWNVLKGNMSLVGPRPHPTPLNVESKTTIRHYALRHLVKPGLTGWAQVNGYRGEAGDPALMQKRIEYDLWYIENWTFWLDIQVIFFTIRQMIRGDRLAY